MTFFFLAFGAFFRIFFGFGFGFVVLVEENRSLLAFAFAVLNAALAVFYSISFFSPHFSEFSPIETFELLNC